MPRLIIVMTTEGFSIIHRRHVRIIAAGASVEVGTDILILIIVIVIIVMVAAIIVIKWRCHVSVLSYWQRLRCRRLRCNGLGLDGRHGNGFSPNSSWWRLVLVTRTGSSRVTTT